MRLQVSGITISRITEKGSEDAADETEREHGIKIDLTDGSQDAAVLAMDLLSDEFLASDPIIDMEFS